MAEWSKAAVLKTVEGDESSVGSNPTLSALIGQSDSPQGVRNLFRIRLERFLRNNPIRLRALDKWESNRFMVADLIFWKSGRVVEGARLLSEYTVKSRIEGSNPSSSVPLGEVTEWPMVLAWKASERVTVPWVRIPPSPLLM